MIGRQHHFYWNFCVDFRNRCLQAEILSAHSQINLNKRTKMYSNLLNTNRWRHNLLPELFFLLYCPYKLCKIKMTAKMRAKSCFYYNLRISAGIGVLFWENRSHCVKNTKFSTELRRKGKHVLAVL